MADEKEDQKNNEDTSKDAMDKAKAAKDVVISKDFKELAEALKSPEGELAKEGASALIDLLKWIFKPTEYKDWSKKKDPERLDEPLVPNGEPPANAPNVTAEITGAKCLGNGWFEIQVKVIGTSGADNDDILQVGLKVPSIDCHGYRLAPPPMKWDRLVEREREEHTFTLKLKCSDLISRSTTKIDVFLWVELNVVDDDGNQRTTFMKLSSPELDEAAAKCCQQPTGQVKPKPETPASLEGQK